MSSKTFEILHEKKRLKITNQVLGQGSFGTVVFAEHIENKTQFAIKIIKIDGVLDQVSEQLLQEAKAEADFLKKQTHPNIVKYEDSFQIGLHYFIVMEKCEKNLQQVIDEFEKSQSFISKEQFVNYACQTLSAIKCLHEQNYLLRDLSLKNILIDSFNQIKLCDFGLVKKIQDEKNSKAYQQSQPKGAFYYYPPELLFQVHEQEDNKKIIQDFNGDIWAFGICFFKLSGGNINLPKLYNKQEFLEKDKQQLDENLNQILLQILNYDINLRPKSIQEILLQFENIKKEMWTAEQAQILFKRYTKEKISNKLSNAFDLITICCQISQKNDIFLFQQGYIQSQLKMFHAAIKSYQNCLKVNPNQHICYYNIGNAYLEIGLFDEAIKSYQEWLKFNPKIDFFGKYYLGIAYQNNKMFNEAIKMFLECLQLDPQHFNCNLNLGSAYYKIGQMDEAKKYYCKCQKLNQNDENSSSSSFICLYNLGNIYYRQHMYLEAIQKYNECENLYSILIKNCNLDEKSFYDQCLQSSYYNLGSAYLKVKKHLESIKNYEKCIQLNKNHKNAMKQLQKLAQQNIAN
ncbi:tetratricopeptide repeat protein (macronuclear) [Tetrahymena thermophila SB210]|uniref:Tetratricopeptide repeat protein n=1 Tax=Tetrahymena thermophila (strain SB210) TaxID=312017 RepID=Q228Z2_TETTS|nr:tetratricopeptide repeat protein [Tetrahymena thermophila SB210]EAR81856.1 tetratricopeptide repeat protein [Tetrahymena thermophila SB210]|eukprot:XP_001029519.1 tetratricopeptide repeat protein [Tetrahymena thermophila SB210]